MNSRKIPAQEHFSIYNSPLHKIPLTPEKPGVFWKDLILRHIP